MPIRDGEDVVEAVRRELLEEAGLNCDVRGLAGTSWFSSEWLGDPLRNLQMNFVVHSDGSDVKLDQSSDDHRWVTRQDIEDNAVPIDAFTRGVIEQAFEARPKLLTPC